MKAFEYIEPTTLQEAVQATAALHDDYRYMAGATALMLVMRQRIVNPSCVVSLRKIAALRGIGFDAVQGLRIGAFTTHREIAESPLVQAHYPVIAYMASIMANPQVRNQGTIGGNLCYGDASTDPPTCLIAHQAQIRLFSPQGYRCIPLQAFYLGFFETDVRDGEVLVEILIPPLPTGTHGVYERFRKTDAEHRPTVNLCALTHTDPQGRCSVWAAVGAATKTPSRLARMEAQLQGAALLPDCIEQLAHTGANELDYIDDTRSSAAYRKRITQVLLERALHQLANHP